MTSREASPARAILYAFLANLGIAVAKLAAALYTASGSMLAESIHSLADSGNQVLLFVGLRGSEKPPDREHPLGYGKLSYFWSFVVALLLFTIGGVFSIFEGVRKLSEPAEVTAPWVGLVVLAASVLLEGSSLIGALREVHAMKGAQTTLSWLKTTRNAEVVVVLGEDSAAIVGLLIAFLFLSATTLTGNAEYDAIGSICIGVVLIIVALFVANRIQSLLVGRSAEPALVRSIERFIEDDAMTEQLFNIITLQFGPRVMLAAKIGMRSGISIDQAVAGINSLERRIREEFPEVGWCFVEPDCEY